MIDPPELLIDPPELPEPQLTLFLFPFTAYNFPVVLRVTITGCTKSKQAAPVTIGQQPANGRGQAGCTRNKTN